MEIALSAKFCGVNRISNAIEIAGPRASSLRTLIDTSCDVLSALHALGITVGEVGGPITQEQRELHQLFHHVDDTVVVGRGLHSAGLVAFGGGLRDRRLVGNRDHPHPAPEYTKLIDRVETLGPAGDLHDGKRSALRRAYAALRKRQPVNLRLHDAGHRAVALRSAPDVSF